jgi:hypothetical protein
MVCLCLAIASIGRAMQRQSDNRHHLIIQVCFNTEQTVLSDELASGDGIPDEIQETEGNESTRSW